jgi:hypothetical protein
MRNFGIVLDNKAQADLIGNFIHKYQSTLPPPPNNDYTNLAVVAGGYLTHLANVYAETRLSIEERFTGEELEDNLRWLSQGFDLLLETVADSITGFAERFFNFDNDESGMSKAELERLRLEFGRFFPGMKDVAISLGQMLRQYAVENGFISSDRSSELFEKFLAKAMDSSFDVLDNDNISVEQE